MKIKNIFHESFKNRHCRYSNKVNPFFLQKRSLLINITDQDREKYERNFGSFCKSLYVWHDWKRETYFTYTIYCKGYESTSHGKKYWCGSDAKSGCESPVTSNVYGNRGARCQRCCCSCHTEKAENPCVDEEFAELFFHFVIVHFGSYIYICCI